MADETMQFHASTRIPVRPLSYENKEHAYPKELLVDYDKGFIYVVTSEKKIIDVTTLVKEAVGIQIEEAKDIEIALENGETVTIEKAIIRALKESVLIIEASIKSGDDNWVYIEETALYMQNIELEAIKEVDYPIVDINLSENYETAVNELDSYSRILKILTFDGYIEVYATEPTLIDISIFMKTDRRL